MFLLGLTLFATLDYAWWIFFVLLFVPDISMTGYLFGNRSGAMVYNMIHHKGLAIAVYAVGFITAEPILSLIGIILFSHASLDRILGYGLKYTDSFQHTHLGRIGKNANHNFRHH